MPTVTWFAAPGFQREGHGLRTETVDLKDLVMEQLVEAGKARRLPEPEVSYKLGRKPAEYYCL